MLDSSSQREFTIKQLPVMRTLTGPSWVLVYVRPDQMEIISLKNIEGESNCRPSGYGCDPPKDAPLHTKLELMSSPLEAIEFGKSAIYKCPDRHYLDNFGYGGSRSSILELVCVNTTDGQGEYQKIGNEWPNCVQGTAISSG